MKRRVFHVEQASRLEAVLRKELELDHEGASELVNRGAVYLDGKRAKDASTRVGPGNKVMVVLEEGGVAVTEAPPPAPTLVVLYEDDDVLAVDKPWGITAQPTPGRVGDSLLDLASAYLKREAGLVHRLDKETSGITVFGKHHEATSALAAAFRDGRARKEYLAVTASGLPASGVISLPLSKDPSRPGRWRASELANGIDAITQFQRLDDDKTRSLVALFPKTGRTHQLRAHLTGIGFPIVGDRLYGGPPGPRCLLHARRLVIDSLVLESPVPPELA
ncbi:MAG: RluA family pseudouridine synthase [Archangium gephyra]|uniref:RluA family pseudouridine synthase n=1 Tax=Archangium gephyra TaxID=48 RepID=A0A2W5U2Y3_9BACT|nr:MAG: RluA family pseudouridine synthase [Archangium gephyra]